MGSQRYEPEVPLGISTAVIEGDVTVAQPVQVVGNVASGDVDSGNPVKIGGRAATAGLAGFDDVSENDRIDAAMTRSGQMQVAIGGGNQWAKTNSVLATPATDFLVRSGSCMVGRISVTGDTGGAAMYALVYDGTSVGGTLIDRFYIPAAGTAVRDYTTEGGLAVGVGCFVQLTSDPGAVTAPGVGGFFHAIYQDR